MTKLVTKIKMMKANPEDHPCLDTGVEANIIRFRPSEWLNLAEDQASCAHRFSLNDLHQNPSEQTISRILDFSKNF